MAKIVEVRLIGMTCEFAGDDGDDLEVGGSLLVQTFDDPSIVKTSTVIFDFPSGAIRMRKGEAVAINRDVRVTMATPSVDPGIWRSLREVWWRSGRKRRQPRHRRRIGEQLGHTPYK